jgi:hypothetical protein
MIRNLISETEQKPRLRRNEQKSEFKFFFCLLVLEVTSTPWTHPVPSAGHILLHIPNVMLAASHIYWEKINIANG